jgi:hypothetical protein
MRQTAKELGVSAGLLRGLVKEFGVRTDASRGMTPEEHSENVRLRRYDLYPLFRTPC